MHQNDMQTSETILEISFYSIYNGESFCICFVCIRCDGCDRVEPLLDGVTVQCFSVSMVLHDWSQSQYTVLSRNHEDKGHKHVK